MTPVEPVGHAVPIAALTGAAAAGTLHHAWLFAGPRGVGKATVAEAMALRLLTGDMRMKVGPDHPARALLAAGSHPDYRVLRRLPKDADKPDEDLARSITVAQVRGLGAMFATAPALGPRRIVVIDAVDDLERSGANALLKNLEEPPAGTTFLLVSHAPGRLLPTIRSRCRLLRFDPLPERDLAEVAARVGIAPDVLAASGGSPGRAMQLAGLDVGGLDQAIAAIAGGGDPDNARRSALARTLGAKAAHARYELFLDRAAKYIAGSAKLRSGPALVQALDAYAAARDLGGAALSLSLDAGATVFEMAGILAKLARPEASPTRR